MKTRIAMMISIAGVLVAGSAAALVNTQVLGGSTAASGLAVDAAPQSEQTNPTTTATTAARVPTTSVAAAAPAVVAAQPPAAAGVSTQAVYSIASSGLVTLDTAGDVLTIVGVTPAAGWVVKESENQDPTNVEIKFQSGSIEAQFHANLLFGVVTTSVESNDTSTTTVSVDNHGSGRVGSGGGSDDSGGGGGSDD